MVQILAMTTMLIDHMGIVFFPEDPFLRIIGRLAFPIYAYAIVQGYVHTRNLNNYIIRLAVIGLLSQLPFMLALGSLSVNVIGTFIVCLLVLISLDRFRRFWSVPITVGAMILLEVFPFDYGSYGLFLVLIYRYMGEQKLWGHLALNMIFWLRGWTIQLFSIFATLIFTYWPRVPQLLDRLRAPKWFWRSFYPAHLTALFLLKLAIERY